MSRKSTKLNVERFEERMNPSSYVAGAGNLIIVARHTAIGSVTFEMLTQSLLRRDVMTAYTPGMLPAGSPLVAGHVSAIRDVYMDSPTDTRMIQRYNPWGLPRP